jgi:hypothetical protein
MIDTIKFKVNVDWDTLQDISRTATHQTLREGYVTTFSKKVELPSYFRSIAIIPDFHRYQRYVSGEASYPLFIEFSLPKQIYDTNIYQPSLALALSSLERIATQIYLRIQSGSYPSSICV